MLGRGGLAGDAFILFPKKLHFKYIISSPDFTLRAGRSHYIGFVAARVGWDGSQYTNTASWAASSPLQQSRPVNNPGFILLLGGLAARQLSWQQIAKLDEL